MFSYKSRKRHVQFYSLVNNLISNWKLKHVPHFSLSTHSFSLLHSKIGNHFSSKLASIPFLNEDYNLAKFEVHSFSQF